MGVLDQVLKLTPFYNSYKSYKTNRQNRLHEKLEQELHPVRVAFYKQFISQNDIVFDVGANVGNRVAAFLECGAKVIAVEPQPACVEVLRSKFKDRITIEHLGLGDRQGELDMHIASDTTVSSFSKEYISNTKERFKYSEWTNTIKVPISTLDLLIQKHGVPRFCKIDVEGYEPEVLKGLHQQIPYLSFEYCVPEMAAHVQTCIGLLNGIAPEGLFNYSIGESMQWAKREWMTYSDFHAHIATAEFVGTSFGDIYFRNH